MLVSKNFLNQVKENQTFNSELCFGKYEKFTFTHLNKFKHLITLLKENAYELNLKEKDKFLELKNLSGTETFIFNIKENTEIENIDQNLLYLEKFMKECKRERGFYFVQDHFIYYIIDSQIVFRVTNLDKIENFFSDGIGYAFHSRQKNRIIGYVLGYFDLENYDKNNYVKFPKLKTNCQYYLKENYLIDEDGDKKRITVTDESFHLMISFNKQIQKQTFYKNKKGDSFIFLNETNDTVVIFQQRG